MSVRLATGSASVVLGAIVLALGFAAGVLMPSPPEPVVLATSTPVRSVPVVTQTFDDERTVEVIPSVAAGPEISTHRVGRVTAVTCEPAAPLVSGTSQLSLDNVPLLFLATALPLWRDLEPGMRGDDVSSLQAELKRLGRLSAEPTGRFDSSTSAALKALWAAIGRADPPRTLDLADTVWLPQPETIAESCAVRLGSSVGDGDVLATTVGRLTRIRLAERPGTDADSRVVRVGDSEGVVQADGTVTDPRLLAALEASPEYASWANSDKTTGIDLVSRLETPFTATVVPPSSVFAVRGGRGCVITEGRAVTVQIVSSSLGKTFVRITGDARPSSVMHDGDAASRTLGLRCG